MFRMWKTSVPSNDIALPPTAVFVFNGDRYFKKQMVLMGIMMLLSA